MSDEGMKATENSPYVKGTKALPVADNTHKVTPVPRMCANGHGALAPICRRIAGEKNRWRLECKNGCKRVDAETLEEAIEIWNTPGGAKAHAEQESEADPKSNG